MSLRVKILYLLLIVLLGYSFWPSNTEKDLSGVYNWNIKTDPTGGVEVFGIKLGQHTLVQAEGVLKSRSERALFIPPDTSLRKEPDLEAFFQQMPDNSKLILGLHADAATIGRIKSRAHNPIAFPSGSIKLQVAEGDAREVDQLKIKMLSYIPRIRLTAKDIQTRFGKPEQILVEQDVKHYLYPKIGLDAILDPSGEAVIQFVEPRRFPAVLESLKQTARPVAQGNTTGNAQ